MPTAYIFKIEDRVVGPCLELIRNVCEPLSTSRPHITVRYPIDKLETNDLVIYEKTRISEIDIVEPGAFGLEGPISTSRFTIFIKCDSDILESLSYKPDYPDSVFHITLYNGKSREFAEQLLNILKKFKWKFCAPLPKTSKLTQIDINRSKKSEPTPLRDYSTKLKALFLKITSRPLTFDYIQNLTDKEKLRIVKLICAYLHETTIAFTRLKEHQEWRPTAKTPSITPEQHTLTGILGEKWLDIDSHKKIKKFNNSHEPILVNKVGLYLTPPELARDIMEYAINLLGKDQAIHFGDPAIGNGIFFSSLHQIIKNRKLGSALGIEIDPIRGEATHRRWAHKGLEILINDYLHLDKLPHRSLIVANPPYVRYQYIEQEYGKKLRHQILLQTGFHLSGQAGLYAYFLLLSHNWMQPGAIAAWLLPSEFMETNFGSTIRRYLTEKVQLIRIHQYNSEEIQFENALVSSSVVVFQNKQPELNHIVSLSKNGSLLSPKYTEKIDNDKLNKKTKWTIPSIEPLSLSLTTRLGDLFVVRRGIATGANSFFIMERTQAVARGIPEEVLRPILPKARALDFDIIESEIDGYPKTDLQLCLLDCNLPIEEIKIKYPKLFKYLKTAPESVLSSTLVRSHRPWYRQEQRDPPPFLCTYMGRSKHREDPLRFIWNKSSAIATNTYLLLYPNEILSKLLTDKPHLTRDLFDVLKNIHSLDLIKNGRMYGGGLHKIEPKELLNVPLAFVPSWLDSALKVK